MTEVLQERHVFDLLTLEILNCDLVSTPPCKRNPHGEPPSRITSLVVIVGLEKEIGRQPKRYQNAKSPDCVDSHSKQIPGIGQYIL